MRKGEMLSVMLVLATDGHAGQFDKGSNPYILHPLTVMHMTHSDDEELQCIAIGHDLLEDTAVTVEILRAAGMSERVINGILAMTKIPNQTFEEYKKQVFSSYDAMLVKRCDLRHNSDIRRLKGVTQKDVDRMVRYHVFFLEIEKRLEGVRCRQINTSQ